MVSDVSLRRSPGPLCIGTSRIAEATTPKGFLIEPQGLDGALDITSHGGWRAFVSLAPVTA